MAKNYSRENYHFYSTNKLILLNIVFDLVYPFFVFPHRRQVNSKQVHHPTNPATHPHNSKATPLNKAMHPHPNKVTHHRPNKDTHPHPSRAIPHPSRGAMHHNKAMLRHPKATLRKVLKIKFE